MQQGSPARAQLGRALVQHRGLSAWMEVFFQELQPEKAPPEVPEPPQSWPPGRGEVVRVLAGMVLSSTEENAL